MVYLAMTAAEMQNSGTLPEKIAWMACHFSPYGTGLTNIPASLPPGSLLILNDRTPVCGHDPVRVADMLHESVQKLQCSGILLDFQRPGCQQTEAITSRILTLPCPVCVSEPYAKNRDCPIFLPPIPLLQTVEEYLQPWQGREIWLELALDGLELVITEGGSQCKPSAPGDEPQCNHIDPDLFCHYRMEFDPKHARFSLKRAKEDLQTIQKHSEKFGVTHAVGLWQELK